MAAPSVYMIAIETDGQRSMVGSGFAVSEDGWLATNAHIADALLRRQALPLNAGGVRAVAIQGDTYDARPIVSARVDPAWKTGSLAHDVALVKLDGKTPTLPLRLANDAAIRGLARGTPIAAFGFPAVSTDASRPRGRLSVDVVGDIRGDYLEVGLGISPGMSGCPVLNRQGVVVAMVVGGDFVQMPDGIPRPSGSSANWALTAASVRAMLTIVGNKP
jgi:S1-C subfamily serine protease